MMLFFVGSLFIVGLYFDFFFIEINEDLVSVVVVAGIPNLYIFGGYFNEDFCILVAVFIVAAPEVFFIALFKASAGFIYHQTAVFRHTFYLDAAVAHGNLMIYAFLAFDAAAAAELFPWRMGLSRLYNTMAPTELMPHLMRLKGMMPKIASVRVFCTMSADGTAKHHRVADFYRR